jgi:hypothetical protein
MKIMYAALGVKTTDRETEAITPGKRESQARFDRSYLRLA